MITYLPDDWSMVEKVLSYANGPRFISRGFGVDVFYSFSEDMKRCVVFLATGQCQYLGDTMCAVVHLTSKTVVRSKLGVSILAEHQAKIPYILANSDNAIPQWRHLTRLDVDAINVMTCLNPAMDRHVTYSDYGHCESFVSGQITLIREKK